MGVNYSRKSLRRPGHDYSAPHTYFITICTHERLPLFGHIENGQMRLNANGLIAKQEWERTFEIRQMPVSPFVVMPNHVHGIIAIGNDSDFGFSDWSDKVRAFVPREGASLGSIIGGIKSAITSRIRKNDASMGEIWQERYFENVIRSQHGYDKIADYIEHNPVRWHEDRFYKR